jgi:hypothetical protein
MMQAVYVNPAYGSVGGPPPQWVAYQAHLYRWSAGRWTYVRSTDRFAATVRTDQAVSPSWLNVRTGIWGNGNQLLPPTGLTPADDYFRILVNYYWLPDQYGRTAGTLTEWADTYDKGWFIGKGYCTY